MISKKSTLLLSKPLEGKKEVIENYAKNALKENKTLLFVLTDKSPEQLKQELLKDKIFFKNAYFVDCYSQQAGLNCQKTENIKYVSGPLALNEISIAVSEFQREFLKKEMTHLIIFDSISTLLMYSNAEAVGRFLQIFIAKIKNLSGEIIFTIEQGMHDEKAIVTIEHLMDSVIEVKKEGNKILTKESGKPESLAVLK
jgi:KaiC/GvpD/RAD55 family RecA-like ATPase